MEGGSNEGPVVVMQHLAEHGLIDDLVGELMKMLVPLNDPARMGEPLGRMMERWEKWERAYFGVEHD